MCWRADGHDPAEDAVLPDHKEGITVKAIRIFSVGAVAAAAMLGMAACSVMSAGGQDAVGGAGAGGFIGYQLVKSR